MTLSSFAGVFIIAFVPLFIAIDALGNLPFLISLSEGMLPKERLKTVHIAVATAAVVGISFLFFGQFILTIMGISVGSFTVAGGVVLLVLSIRHMTTGRWVELMKEEIVAIVPIGTPLTVGPATITTLLLLARQYNTYIVLIAFGVNLLITWVIFLLSQQFGHLFGKGGLQAISSIFSLLLAAIAVSMVFRGLTMQGIIP